MTLFLLGFWLGGAICWGMHEWEFNIEQAAMIPDRAGRIGYFIGFVIGSLAWPVKARIYHS